MFCWYSVLQCKVVQTVASFPLTEYEVTEWAADLNLLLLEYFGGGVGCWGVHHTTLCVFNPFGPFSIPLIGMNICLLSSPSITLWEEVKIEAVAGWNSLFKFTCYILSLYTHHPKDHFQHFTALTFHLFLVLFFVVPLFGLSAICLLSQCKKVLMLILQSVVWQTAADASWFWCSPPSANECMIVLWLQSGLFPLLTRAQQKISSADILLKVHAQADNPTRKWHCNNCSSWKIISESI